MADGGEEFAGSFPRGLGHLGIDQHVCDAESPWQNGRCERRGGLVRGALDRAAPGALLHSGGNGRTLVRGRLS
eukprot:3967691-Pyramimonas_sp.AAC.1